MDFSKVSQTFLLLYKILSFITIFSVLFRWYWQAPRSSSYLLPTKAYSLILSIVTRLVLFACELWWNITSMFPLVKQADFFMFTWLKIPFIMDHGGFSVVFLVVQLAHISYRRIWSSLEGKGRNIQLKIYLSNVDSMLFFYSLQSNERINRDSFW